MNTQPIGILVEDGMVVGIINCDKPAHVIDLDTQSIRIPDEMTLDEYRDYVEPYQIADYTGNSPFAQDSTREKNTTIDSKPWKDIDDISRTRNPYTTVNINSHPGTQRKSK